jgi:hypothetical protein
MHLHKKLPISVQFSTHCLCNSDTLLQARACRACRDVPFSLECLSINLRVGGSNPIRAQVISSVTFGDSCGISGVKGGLDAKSGSMIYQPH